MGQKSITFSTVLCSASVTGIIGWKVCFLKEGARIFRKRIASNQKVSWSLPGLDIFMLHCLSHMAQWEMDVAGLREGAVSAAHSLDSKALTMSCRWCSPSSEIREPLCLADGAWENVCLKVSVKHRGLILNCSSCQFLPLTASRRCSGSISHTEWGSEFIFCMSFMVQVSAAL